MGDFRDEELQDTLTTGNGARVVREREQTQKLCRRGEAGSGKIDVKDQEVQTEISNCVLSGSVKSLRSSLNFKKDVPVPMT